MKNQFKKSTILPLDVELESEFLSASVVEIESSVTVEEYKDGFTNLGSDGFEVDFN